MLFPASPSEAYHEREKPTCDYALLTCNWYIATGKSHVVPRALTVVELLSWTVTEHCIPYRGNVDSSSRAG